MEAIILSQDLILKYPHTFKAIKSCYKEKIQLPASFLFMLQNKAIRYWSNAGVNSDFFHARFPDNTQLIRMAKLASKRHIMYWHPWHMEVTHKTYQLGKDIDWFTPPTGDHEWVDSLVRFTHMIDLAAAYELTHKERYLLSFQSYLNSFSIARHKPGRHWKFLINVAVRLINLIRAYDLISHVDILPLSTHLEVLENIVIDINFLLNSLNKARGNGAFFATTALLIASEYLEEIFDVEEWRALSEKKLDETFRTEIQPDSIEVEQVPMYHGQVILALLDYCIILKANNRPIDTCLKNTIRKMLDALLKLSDPQGYIPTIGDSDKYSSAYIVDFYNIIFNTEPIQSSNTIILNNAEHCHLTTFNTSGWVVARWNYDSKKQGYLLFDCSGKPGNQKSGHSHADDLQFLLHTSNGSVFIDPGRFTYCTDFKAYYPFTKKRIYPIDKFHYIYALLFPKFMALYGNNWKDYFKRTLSHNTISLNGENQPGYSKRTDPRSETDLLQQQKTGPLVLLQGYLDTTISKEDNEKTTPAFTPYQHKRTILGVLPHLWIIVDQMKAAQKCNWVSSYHLDIDAQASIKNKGIHIEAKGGSHYMTFLNSTATHQILSIDDDWVSHIYNKKISSKTIRATINDVADTVLITVIQSLENNKTRLDEAKVLTKDIFQLKLTNGSFTTTVIINPSCRSLEFGEFEFDGFLNIESRNRDQLIEAGFIGGTFLRSNDFSLSSNTHEQGAYQSFVLPE